MSANAGRYVAVLDTGGISYSSDTFVAIGHTELAATDAVARKYLAAHGGHKSVGRNDTILRTPADVAEWFGIKVAGPILDGAAVLTEW